MPIISIPPEWRIGDLPSVKEGDLPSGAAGNMATVNFMVKIARERAGSQKVRALATAIVNGVKSMHYLDESRAIGEYVQRNVRYVRDPSGIERLTDPDLMIEEIQTGRAQGDCDDMALLVASLLLSIGHDPFFRVVRYKGWWGPFNHIYVVDYEKNVMDRAASRIVLDAIVKIRPIGFEVPHSSGKEIPV